MGRPIYVDLDATLIDSDVDERGNVIAFTLVRGPTNFSGICQSTEISFC